MQNEESWDKCICSKLLQYDTVFDYVPSDVNQLLVLLGVVTDVSCKTRLLLPKNSVTVMLFHPFSS